MEDGWIGWGWMALQDQGAAPAPQDQGGPRTGQQQPNEGAGAPAKPRGIDPCAQMAFPMVAIFLLFYFIILRPQRRQEQARREQLAALKKNDRVVTVGGIHGTVTNVRPDEDEVTIRVDDVTNTKLRVSRASIARVVRPETDGTGKERAD